jgi:hypothetical protein
LATRPAAAADGSVGIASFYKYEGKTASGEQFRPGELTAAHRTLPFGTRLRARFKTGTFSGVRTLAGRADTLHGRVRFVISLSSNDGAMRFRLLKAIQAGL